MTATDLLDKVWEYPLFEALYGRRTRRFGRGFATAEGPFRHASAHPPMPLDAVEEALLVAAGYGFSGVGLWDLSRPSARGGGGRTFPSTTAGGRTALFFTNDQGVYVIDPAGGAPSKPREIETLAERDRILALYRDHRRELARGRLDIPRRMPPICGHNLWDSNRPGSTLFMPVCDVSVAMISLIAQFVDPALRRFAPERGMNIVDDRHGFRPAGTAAWLKSGLVAAENPLPLSLLERQACYYTFSEPAAICQNIFLATEALGLGGWMHCGYLSFEVLRQLGFRMVAGKEAAMPPNPIGLDGVFEASCPPYYASMDAAVDAVLAPRPRQGGDVPYRMAPSEHRAGTVAPSAEGIACTKAVCAYILDTYGRFPGGIDALQLMWFMQVHHIDIDYYDKFFRPGAYGPTQAAHMAIWHGEAEGRD